MPNRITIGRYCYGTSKIHKWNPILKLICSFIFVISVLLCKNWISLTFLGILLILLLLQSELPFSYYLKCIWSIRYFLLFFFLFNLLFGVSFVKDTLVIFQMIVIVLYSVMVLYTTSIRNLIYSFTYFLYPLSWIGVPIFSLAQVIGLSISFLPIILLQASKIMKSLIVRGIDYKNGTLKQKFQIIKVILFPLFDLSFEYADGVSDTMEVRLYTSNKKNFYFQKLSISFFELFQLVLHILILILVLKEGTI